MHSGSWPAAEAALAALPLDQASLAMVYLSEVDGVEAFLEWSVTTFPTSPWARACLAQRYVVIGWEVRTGNLAKDVSRDQFAVFHDWLQRAEDLHAPLFAQMPQFAPAWSVGIIVALGLQFDMTELRHRHTQLSTLSPHNWPVQSQVLQFVLPKWSGDWNLAGNFVREAINAAPRGSNCGALIAEHHLEWWMSLGAGTAGAAHLQRPDVLADLRDAASRSVLAGDAPLDSMRAEAHGTFLMAFYLGGNFEDAAVHARVLGERATVAPWYHITESETKVAGIYRQVLGEKKRWFGR